MKCRIHNNAKFEGLDALAKDLFEFAHKQFKFTKPTTIVFESNIDNVGKLFAPTGHYSPQSSTVTIYVDHRHPKDILRSLAHELVHHKQNCDGHFQGAVSTDPGYAQRDQHMREMEGDAYRTGNVMLFRDWEDSYKRGNKLMNENKEKIAEKVKHDCANHVKENLSGREGTPINHTLLEDGTVTHYTVEFLDEIVEKIPVDKLTILQQEGHDHAAKREDNEHDEDKPRRVHEEEEDIAEEAEEKPLKEWYNNNLHEALLRKFKIKK